MKNYLQIKEVILIVLMGFLFINTNSLIAQEPLKWGSDIIISNQPTENQINAKLDVAFNGWLFSSYESNGKLYIKKSIDNGLTWVDFFQSNAGISASDMIVCGNTVEDLSVYISGFYSPLKYVFVLKVGANNLAASERLVYNVTNNVKDVKIASDYKFPAVGANPYSVSICFSISTGSYDSIICMTSVDGGNTFPLSNKKVVDVTPKWFGNVSIAYGRSMNNGFGRYFVAYEQINGLGEEYGNIKYSNTTDIILGDFTKPISLDSIISNYGNKCRKPSIVCQYDNEPDPNSSNAILSTIVGFEKNYSQNDNDLIYFHNINPTEYNNTWNLGSFSSTYDNELQINLSYDPTYHNFLATYFNETKKEMSYIVKNFASFSSNNWSLIKTKINTSNELSNPNPQVEINPVLNQAAFVWIQDGTPSTNGISIFNAEYSIYDAIQHNENTNSEFKIFPNPANNTVNIEISNNEKENFYIEIINITGKIIKTENIQSNNKTISIDISDIPAGIYICKLLGSNKTSLQKKLIINH